MEKVEKEQEPGQVSNAPVDADTGIALPIPSPVLGYDFLVPSPEAILHCAMLCHHVVKALNDAHGEETLPWESNKHTTQDGVYFILNNPDATAEDSHNNWMKYKLDSGWTLGPTKDEQKKTHPLLVPYEKLDLYQRSKDAIFGAIVRTYFGL